MHDYYYRSESSDWEDEVIIQATGNTIYPLSISVTGDYETVMLNLPFEEIDRMIAGLEAAKKKILARR